MKTKKRLKRMLATSFMMIAAMVAHAQNTLTREANMMRIGDVENKETVDYAEIGKGGDDACWDFSQASTIGLHSIVYTCDSDSIDLKRIESNMVYRYNLNDDSLFLSSIETPQMIVRYDKPVFCLKYPVGYGYCHSAHYSGEGKYCGTHFVRQFGTVEVESDGQGTLILSEKDTLRNVLRVFMTTTSCTRICRDSCLNDSDNLKHEIIERYQWYARGYRYPVFETILQTTYHDMAPVASNRFSYRYSPEDQRLNPDSLNEKIQNEDIMAWNQQETPSIFSYKIQNDNNNITIEYDLSESAHIRILVCDVMGILYRKEDFTESQGYGYTKNIDCNGLHHGQYILYINVNGNIYSNKIVLQ